jgi:DNA-directed RNA polymerase specialized sigma24 family protein
LLGEPAAEADGTRGFRPKVVVMPADERLRPTQRGGHVLAYGVWRSFSHTYAKTPEGPNLDIGAGDSAGILCTTLGGSRFGVSPPRMERSFKRKPDGSEPNELNGLRSGGRQTRRPGVKKPAVRAPVLVVVRNTPVRADAVRLERVYEEEGARLWRAVYLYAADREVASDAVAEAFAQALRRGGDLRSPERWVWRTAFRIAAGELKRRRNEAGSLTESRYEVPDETAELLVALPRLSPKQRAAIVLHYHAGYSLKEVADIIGSTDAVEAYPLPCVASERVAERFRVIRIGGPAGGTWPMGTLPFQGRRLVAAEAREEGGRWGRYPTSCRIHPGPSSGSNVRISTQRAVAS